MAPGGKGVLAKLRDYQHTEADPLKDTRREVNALLLLRLSLVTSISVCLIPAEPVVMSSAIGALRAQLRKQARFSAYTEGRRCINAVTPQLLLMFQGRSVHTRLPTVTPSTVVVAQACTLLAPIIILDECLMVDRPGRTVVTTFPF
jgi:hypothetical protein